MIHAQQPVSAKAASSMRCSLSEMPRLSSHRVSEANSAAASACVQKAISACMRGLTVKFADMGEGVAKFYKYMVNAGLSRPLSPMVDS